MPEQPQPQPSEQQTKSSDRGFTEPAQQQQQQQQQQKQYYDLCCIAAILAKIDFSGSNEINVPSVRS